MNTRQHKGFRWAPRLGAVIGAHPRAIAMAWGLLTAAVLLFAPNLSKRAAEHEGLLLPPESETVRAAVWTRQAWPDLMPASSAVAVLHRESGLTDADRAAAQELATAFRAADHPANIQRVLGPDSDPEIAGRLKSRDGRSQMVVANLATDWTVPKSQEAVAWMKGAAGSVTLPKGLSLVWAGDAAMGVDYMGAVKTTLDRAALVTIVLLTVLLMWVYRSAPLALIPLVTIGAGLLVSRGLLAWADQFGWTTTSLVELFLVVVLFGTGTDLCLFLSWRFAERWSEGDPTEALRATMIRTAPALVATAGTAVFSLCLMGNARFALFAKTGLSVAFGIIVGLCAALTLTPALLLLLARHRPQSFDAFRRRLEREQQGFWNTVGCTVMRRPLAWGLLVLAAMIPVAISFGVRSRFSHDMIAELPANAPSKRGLTLMREEFGDGSTGPLTVVLKAEKGLDWHSTEGLALIDDVSRLLDHREDITEVRSATQPLGSAETLSQARLSSRLEAIAGGFERISQGADQLWHGLSEGAAKLRLGMSLESMLNRLPKTSPQGEGSPPAADDHRQMILDELAKAIDGSHLIAQGSTKAEEQLRLILDDPTARNALDRLIITAEDRKANPDLGRGFAAYISTDGSLARLDVAPKARLFSNIGLDQATKIRERLKNYLDERAEPKAEGAIGGPNAGAADVRDLTEADQEYAWIVVPLGVFFVLWVLLRDIRACINLVATMILTYWFTMGITHVVFVDILGNEGLDWKVAYFVFVLLLAIGVDYNIFLMTRLKEDTRRGSLRGGIARAIGHTGGLISSAAAITAFSFASFLASPLGSIRQIGFALALGITVDALLVRPVLVPCGHWLLMKGPSLGRRLKPRPPSGRGNGLLAEVKPKLQPISHA